MKIQMYWNEMWKIERNCWVLASISLYPFNWPDLLLSSSLWCSSQRYETLLKDMEKKSEQHREVLSSLQQEFQKAQGMAVGKA